MLMGFTMEEKKFTSFTKSISNQIYTIQINLDINEVTIYRGRDSGMSDTKPIFDDDGKLDYTIGSQRYYIEKKYGNYFGLDGSMISRQAVINAVGEIVTDICRKLERKINPKPSTIIMEKKSEDPSIVNDFLEGKQIRLECTSGKHNKFWSAMTTSPTSYIRAWGRIDAINPQSKEFDFPTTDAMIKDFERELNVKLSKKEDPYHYVGSSK